MKLYVANGTRQRFNFYYTLPEVVGHRNQPIEIGQQISISGELSPGAIDAIVEHHRIYGMIKADEINAVRDAAPLVYSIDAPVQPSVIERLVQHNDRCWRDRGRQIREEAGLAAKQEIDKFVDEARPPGEMVRNLQMSVVEETRDPNDTSDAFAEGVHVVSDPSQVPGGMRKRPRNRR